jgi:hypothetical protein
LSNLKTSLSRLVVYSLGLIWKPLLSWILARCELSTCSPQPRVQFSKLLMQRPAKNRSSRSMHWLWTSFLHGPQGTLLSPIGQNILIGKLSHHSECPWAQFFFFSKEEKGKNQ